MKIKEYSIFIIITLLLVLVTTQSIFAVDDEEVISDENDDFSIPDTVEVNSTNKVEVSINSSSTVVKNDLTLKLNKSGIVSDITNFEVSDKKIKFDLDDNDLTQTILHVKYKNINTQTDLKKIININIEALNLESPYQVGNYSFKVTDADTGEIVSGETIRFSLHIRGSFIDYYDTQTPTTNDEGIATYYLNKIQNQNTNSRNINVGEYNITISGMNKLKGSIATTVKVTKADVIIKPNEYREDKGSSKKFTLLVVSKDTGEAIKGAILSLYIPNTEKLYYTITTNNQGIGEIAVSGLNIGNYPTTISTNDSNLNSAQADATIIINKINLKITVESLITYFNSGKTAIIKVTNVKTSKAVSNIQVQIKVDGIDYVYKTDKNGRIEFATSINIGTHKIEFNVLGSNYNASSVSKTLTIKKATGKFTTSTKTFYYKSGKYLIIKLTNTKNKKGIFNGKIHFKIKTSKTQYSNYYGTTQSEGKIRFNVDLAPGTYKVSISGDDNKNFNVKTITAKIIVKKSPLKLTTKTSKKKLQIKVTNKKSKKLVSGIKLKVKVFTSKKSKTFTQKSNSKGICNINLKSIKNGSHKIIITTTNKYYTLKTFKKSVKISG